MNPMVEDYTDSTCVASTDSGAAYAVYKDVKRKDPYCWRDTNE